MATSSNAEPTDAHRHALAGVCSAVRGLLVAADRDEILTRYRVGQALRGAREAPHRYGSRSVERVAEELGLSARVLYRHVSVADAWSEPELLAQLERSNRFGRTVSWTQLVALAAVEDRMARAALLDECLMNQWSARVLEQRIADSARASRDPDAARQGEVVHAALREGIQTAGRISTDLRLFEEALGERLDGINEGVDSALLARTVESFERTRARLDAALERLRGATESQRRLRFSPPVEPDEEPATEESAQRAGGPRVAGSPRPGRPRR